MRCRSFLICRSQTEAIGLRRHLGQMGVPGEVPEDHPLYGLYAVKKGFGGELTEFAGEMDLITNPFIYFLAENGEKFVRFVRRTVKTAGRKKR